MGGNIIKIATSNSSPQGRACLTCRYRVGQAGDFAKCGFVSTYCSTARNHEFLCGPGGRNWELRPPRQPIGGVLGWIIRILVGG